MNPRWNACARRVFTPAAMMATMMTWLAPAAAAQNASISGWVSSPEPGSLARYTVELWKAPSRRAFEAQHLAADGAFEFRNLPLGAYELRVTGAPGGVLRRAPVQLSSNSASVSLDVPGNRSYPQGANTVSVAALRHKAPGRAVKELERSRAAHLKKDYETEVEHLRRALAIDPAFTEAYNRLGLAYILLARNQEACEAFQAAVFLDGGSPALQNNLAAAYVALEKFPEAERAARAALHLNSTWNNSRFLLGVALEAQRREPHEAIENLTAAAREYPQARIFAARVWIRLGEKLRALAELRKYLSGGAAPHRKEVETWVARLSAPQH